MAWTVSLQKKVQSDGTIIALLTYSDGTRTIQDRFDLQGALDNTTFAQRAKAKIDFLTAQDAAFAALVEGAVTPQPPPDPPPPPAPTQAEIDRAAFISDYQNLLGVRRAIAAGVFTGSEAFITTLTNRVKSEFIAAYVPLL